MIRGDEVRLLAITEREIRAGCMKGGGSLAEICWHVVPTNPELFLRDCGVPKYPDQALDNFKIDIKFASTIEDKIRAGALESLFSGKALSNVVVV